ncbi:MAG TPA: acetyl-CoA C-acyltransferase [Polyangia bacterium]
MIGARPVFIVEALRTPVGRYGGALAEVRPDDLAAAVIAQVITRTGIDAQAIDDVVLGCANQAGEDNRNVARMAGLLAGLPVSVPGTTVNRLCGSGLEALAHGARAIASGEAEIVIAGGVESMSRAPLVMAKPREAFPRGDVTMYDSTLGWRFVNPKMAKLYGTEPLGETAERVAEKYGITRERQDAFALTSQQRWAAANAAGKFGRELVPIEVPARKGPPTILAVDEHPRPETTAADLARLRPVFRAVDGPKPGTVTAGNSSGINDGAAALLLMSEPALATTKLKVKPLARWLGCAVAGVPPSLMGEGPIPAVAKLNAHLGAGGADGGVSSYDLIELNEAFAAQAVACIDALGFDGAKVNVNGGAIAIGHPLGASGARMITTLVHELGRSGGKRGLATMCIGVGQGIAAAIERV